MRGRLCREQTVEGDAVSTRLINFKKGEAILGLVTDVTAQKNYEIELQEGKTHLAQAQHIAKTGSWSWDLISGEVTWSDEMFRIYGVDPKDFKGDAWNIIDNLTHPEDREKLRNITDNAIRQGKSIKT